MPLLVEVGEKKWVAVTEANLTDWAGMYVKALPDRDFTLETALAPYPDDPELLVRSNAPRYSPWRLIMIGESPGDFIESDIIANLNEPNALDDVSWIQPGKSAWDWWWCNRYSPDVDFELGPNTATMKHFIDLAAEIGDFFQRFLLFGGGTADFLCQYGDSDTAPPGGIKTVFDSNIIVDNDSLDIDAFSLAHHQGIFGDGIFFLGDGILQTVLVFDDLNIFSAGFRIGSLGTFKTAIRNNH